MKQNLFSVMMLIASVSPAVAAVSVDFTYNNFLGNISLGSMILDFNVDGSGDVTLDASSTQNGAAADVWDGPVGSVTDTDLWNQSFSLGVSTQGGSNNIGLRPTSGGHIGVTGQNPGRIDQQGTESLVIDLLSGFSAGSTLGIQHFSYANSTTANDGNLVLSTATTSMSYDLTSSSAGTVDVSGDGISVVAGGRFSFRTQTETENPPSDINSGAGLSGFTFDVLPPEQPELRIDRGTGVTTLMNAAGATLEAIGFSYLSSSGALDPTGWASITDNYDSDSATDPNTTLDPDSSWILFNNTPFELSEGGIGLAVLDSGQSVDLGKLYLPGMPEDVTAEYSSLDGGALATIDVSFFGTAAVVDPDFDNDGKVTGLDFLAWQQNVEILDGSAMNSQGDANGDGFVNFADLGFWEDFYGSSSATAIVKSVPEPNTLFVSISSLVISVTLRYRS